MIRRLLFISVLVINFQYLCAQTYMKYENRITGKDKFIPSFIDLKISDFSSVKKSKEVDLSQLLKLNEETSIQLTDTLLDVAGGLHKIYKEYYKGIEVEGTRCIVHFDKNRVPIFVNGNFKTVEDVNVEARISEEEALSSAIDLIGAEKYAWNDEESELRIKNIFNNPLATNRPKGKLVIFVKEGQARLTFKFRIDSVFPFASHFVYVDAMTGIVVDIQNALCTFSDIVTTLYSGQQLIEMQYNNGVYQLRDYTRGNGIETYKYNGGYDYSSSSSLWNNILESDRAALDAHWGLEKTYDFYYNKFGRNSYDNQGATIQSYVNMNYPNAYWANSHIVFGIFETSPLVCLDIAAHELTHAFTQSTSNLSYTNESGALNEGLSDVFAASVEHFVKPTNGIRIWQMGEDAVLTRDLSNPVCKKYGGLNWIPTTSNPNAGNDYGGVHTNSGVFGYWFYLLVNGCNQFVTNGMLLDIDGIGFDKAINICYYMNAVMLTSDATFADACQYSYLAAQCLGYSNYVQSQIYKSWLAVGVEELNLSISGSSHPCDNPVYSVTNLPTGYSVDWSLSPDVSILGTSILTTDTPQQNQCTIDSYDLVPWATSLRADVKNATGDTIVTLSKVIRNTFDVTFTQTGGTIGGVTYPSIGPSTVSSTGTIAVNHRCGVSVESPFFDDMTISHSGASPSFFSVFDGSINFVFPTVASTQYMTITGRDGCRIMQLNVQVIPNPNIPIPMLEISPTANGYEIQIVWVGDADAVRERTRSVQNTVWELNIVNATSGEAVECLRVKGDRTTISTTGWKPGAYVLQAFIDGQKTTKKMLVK